MEMMLFLDKNKTCQVAVPVIISDVKMKENDILGSGAMATVRRATYHDRPVAAKVLFTSYM